jgi:XapX domain-containing protein
MIGALVSLAMGLAVGVAYGLVQIRSPAPPLIALLGLLGMVLGEQMVTAIRHHIAPPAAGSGQQPADDVPEERKR